MNILETLPDDFEIDFNPETVKEYMSLLHTVTTIHKLFHANNPFLFLN